MPRRLLALAALLCLMMTACGSLDAPTPGIVEREVQRRSAPTSRPAAPTAIPERTFYLVAFLAVDADDPRSLGSPDAPVTIIEYSDFECPYCAAFVRDTMPQLAAEYIDSGLVRLVYRDLAIETHPSALVAAVAGRCAGAQQQFWPMHDKLFATHGLEWGGAPRRDLRVMVEFAVELGLDTAVFERCLNDASVIEAASSESRQALAIGLNSTPSFLINDKLLIGTRPIETFREVIDAALRQQQ